MLEFSMDVSSSRCNDTRSLGFNFLPLLMVIVVFEESLELTFEPILGWWSRGPGRWSGVRLAISSNRLGYTLPSKPAAGYRSSLNPTQMSSH